MQELLEHIVKGIVNQPDGVLVEVRESVDFPGLTIFEITVAQDDIGILIGRRGRTINAIRDIMTISAIRNDSRIKVLVNDDKKDQENDSSYEESTTDNDHTTEEEVDDQVEDMLSDDDL